MPAAWALDEITTRDVAGTQRGVLRRITGFESVVEFQERVPLSNEPGTLREPVLARLPTSGTTGTTKWIPYTASLYREFQRGIAPWIASAETLAISEKTVKSHISNILGKLHLADRTQAAVYAWQEGIVRRE